MSGPHIATVHITFGKSRNPSLFAPASCRLATRTSGIPKCWLINSFFEALPTPIRPPTKMWAIHIPPPPTPPSTTSLTFHRPPPTGPAPRPATGAPSQKPSNPRNPRRRSRSTRRCSSSAAVSDTTRATRRSAALLPLGEAGVEPGAAPPPHAAPAGS